MNNKTIDNLLNGIRQQLPVRWGITLSQTTLLAMAKELKFVSDNGHLTAKGIALQKD